jgi:hypothetical protein
MKKQQRINSKTLFAHNVPLCPNVLCLHYDQYPIELDDRTNTYLCHECGFAIHQQEVLIMQKQYQKQQAKEPQPKEKKLSKIQQATLLQERERAYNKQRLLRQTH